MNIRQVLKAFTALRQLTDDESALLETLRGMSETERESLVVALQPEKATTKRASKKSSKGGSKSPRASGMAAAINRSLSQGRQATGIEDGDDLSLLCRHQFENGGTCKRTSDHNVHHLQTDSLYHEFDTGKSSTSTAPPAHGRSSTNGGATSGTVSSETEREDVGVVV